MAQLTWSRKRAEAGVVLRMAAAKVFGYSVDTVYAIDAKTGKAVETFGAGGALKIINKALEFKYPGEHPAGVLARDLGWGLSSPPKYLFNNTLYIGTSDSDNLISGGLIIAADATTGAINGSSTRCHSRPRMKAGRLRKTHGPAATVPAVVCGCRRRSIPELGLINFATANPSPDYDGSARLGMNLFTNSTVALDAATGKLAWHYQTVHHDLWDRDLITGPVLFDLTINGQPVKAVGTGGKACYAYFWDRQTGKPLNPIVEMPVPSETDVPGEKPWPTQPIPFTASGAPQQPFCAVYPTVTDPSCCRA